jgi:hypothetical protein
MTMKKKQHLVIALAVLLPLIVFMPLSCDLISGGNDDGKDGDPTSFPENVLEVAGGIFSLIGMVFESETEDPTESESYPTGMTVSWVAQPTVLEITLTDMTPPDWGTVVIEGSITLTQISDSPFIIEIEGTVTLTNYSCASIALDGTATWAAGADPGDSEPESITGTFTVDGTTYDLADLVAAMEEEEEEEEEPPVLNPLPVDFMTHLGNFSQDFDDRLWRIGPAALGAHWSEYNYMRFNISEDGSQHTLYRTSEEPSAGFLNWYLQGETQKLDFMDPDGGVLYSFTVLDYSTCHLHLLGTWGVETREWIFSAGIDNLSGVVVDGADEENVDFYLYYKPITEAIVHLGSYVGEVFLPCVTTTTDERGYFEFLDFTGTLEPLEQPWIQVIKEGYVTSTTMANRGLPIPPDSQVFEYLTLNPSP